jgi:hypothetical protein
MKKALAIVMMIGCGGGVTANVLAGAWWRCDPASADCSTYSTQGIEFDTDGNYFELGLGSAATTYTGLAPLCIVPGPTHSGSYTVTGGTLHTVDQGGVGNDFPFSIDGKILTFGGNRLNSIDDIGRVGGTCM